MVKLMRSVLEALEKAWYLSEFARVCRDPDRLRETALAVLRDQPGWKTQGVGNLEGKESSHRLAA